MTNKEAIEELRELVEVDLHPCDPIYKEAIDLAIKALEHKPSRGCIEYGTNCCLAEIRGEYCPTLAKIMEVEND